MVEEKKLVEAFVMQINLLARVGLTLLDEFD